MPSVLTSLVNGRHAHDAFSLCFSDRSGLYLLGGRPDIAAMRARGALSLPMVGGARARYTLGLREIKVSGSGSANSTFKSLGLPSSTYAPTLVDSGTTFVYASTPLFRALHVHLKAQTPSLTREGGKVCAMLSEAQLHAMPSMQLVFTASPVPLLVQPHQYMVEFPRAAPLGRRHYCAAIFDNQRGGTVIGASIMRHREVIFDITANSITFADTDCNRLKPATSLLQEAYSFAECPPSNSTKRGPRQLAGDAADTHSWFPSSKSSVRKGLHYLSGGLRGRSASTDERGGAPVSAGVGVRSSRSSHPFSVGADGKRLPRARRQPDPIGSDWRRPHGPGGPRPHSRHHTQPP